MRCLRVAGYALRVTSCELRVAGSGYGYIWLIELTGLIKLIE